MRARLLKPGFFHNADLLDTSPWARLLFAGLWCLADREGRLEDRPRQIKIELFPADDVDVDALLAELRAAGVVLRYEVGGRRCVCIPAFVRHQNPHHREPESELPAPEIPGQPQASPGNTRLDAEIPGQPQASRAVTMSGNHVRLPHSGECAPVERVAAAAAPARAPRPVEVAGSEPGTARAAPKPNKLGDVVDAVKAAGGAVTTSARDGKAVKECSAPAQLIADAYLAASRGEWGDDFTRRNLALWFICSRIDGYRAHAAQARASPGDATSRFQGGKYGRLVQA